MHVGDIIVYKKDSKLSDVKEMETELAWIHELETVGRL